VTLLLPSLAVEYPRDTWPAHAVSTGDAFVRFPLFGGFLYRADVGCGQLGPAMPLASRMNGAFLPLHVENIVPLSANGEMVDVDADPVIATVDDAFGPGMLAVEEQPRGSVGKPRLVHERQRTVSSSSTLAASPLKASVLCLAGLEEESIPSISEVELIVASPCHAGHCASTVTRSLLRGN